MEDKNPDSNWKNVAISAAVGLSAISAIVVTTAASIYGAGQVMTAMAAIFTAAAPAIIIGAAVIAGVALLSGGSGKKQAEDRQQSRGTEQARSASAHIESPKITTAREQFHSENKSQQDINVYAKDGLGAALLHRSQHDTKELSGMKK